MVINFFDIDNKELEIGHIVVVRYAWNSYVGEIRSEGVCATGAFRHAFFSPHALKATATYQIIGHIDEFHKDFNSKVLDWYKSEDNNYECPIGLRIYNNFNTVL